jgi:hypothetical protein
VCGCCLGKGRDPHLDVLQHGAKRKSIVHTHKFCSSSFWMLGRRPETFRDLFFPPKFFKKMFRVEGKSWLFHHYHLICLWCREREREKFDWAIL